jgi:hypothetical protein
MIIINNSGPEVITYPKISLTSSQILNLNSTPQQLMPSPGVGKTYEILGILGRLNFNTTAYTTNLQIQIYYLDGGLVLASNSNLLNATLTKTGKIILTAIASAGANQYLENTPIYCNVAVGNPAAGAGTLDLWITYKVITL